MTKHNWNKIVEYHIMSFMATLMFLIAVAVLSASIYVFFDLLFFAIRNVQVEWLPLIILVALMSLVLYVALYVRNKRINR